MSMLTLAQALARPKIRKVLAILLYSTLLFANSVGPSSGTATGSGWTSPANVGASDNTYASVAIAGTGGTTCSKCEPGDPGSPVPSTALYISSLGFSLPTGATVTGIQATVEHKCSGASSCSTETTDGGKIQLTKAPGTGQGTNKGNTVSWGTA